MKTLKTLLLGSAAGLVAVVGAQAADMEVKAKPVQYVRICSQYGDGYYYVPGVADICIKVGATVRATAGFDSTGSGLPYISGSAGRNNRIDSADVNFDGRATVWMDARMMTPYGTLRGYFSGGFDAITNSNTVGTAIFERAFIQFMGFTVGKNQSNFDFMNGEFSYSASTGGGSNTYVAGPLQAAYTFKGGNGVAATVAFEDNTMHRNALWDAGTNALAVGAFPGPNGTLANGFFTCGVSLITPDGNNNITNQAGAPAIASTNVVGCATGDYAAQQIPDIVGSLRVDQAWGSAQIAGALHQVRAGYYGNNFTNNNFVGPGGYTGVAPGDEWGWAVMGGVTFNVPSGPGDRFWVEGVYSEGATGYTGLQQGGNTGTLLRFSGNTLAQGQALDGIFANTIGPATPTAAGLAAASSAIQLTTAWTVGAAFEHYWSPTMRSSVFGNFTQVSYNPTATAIYCSAPVGSVRTAAGAAPNFATGAVIGCDPDFQVWSVGMRSIWKPFPYLELGSETLFTQIDQNMDPATVRWNFGGAGGRVAGLYTPADLGTWSSVIRAKLLFNVPSEEGKRS